MKSGDCERLLLELLLLQRCCAPPSPSSTAAGDDSTGVRVFKFYAACFALAALFGGWGFVVQVLGVWSREYDFTQVVFVADDDGQRHSLAPAAGDALAMCS